MWTDSVVQESLRLAGRALVLRQITKDTTFETHDGKKYFLRQGNHIVTYPWLTHSDPEVFVNPQVINLLFCLYVFILITYSHSFLHIS